MKSYFPKSRLGIHSAPIPKLRVIPPAFECDVLIDLASEGGLKDFSESSLHDFCVPIQPKCRALSDRAKLLLPCSITALKLRIL